MPAGVKLAKLDNMIQVYTGNGKGKTTAAFGLALRASAHNKKIAIIQFMKNYKGGEYKIARKLPNVKIKQFGRKELVNLQAPSDEDIEIAKKGLEFAYKMLKEKPDLIILDEINVALGAHLLKIPEVLKFLEQIPKKTEVVLTGRYAPKEIIQIADLVTEMKEIKHPFKSGVKARKGIEY